MWARRVAVSAALVGILVLSTVVSTGSFTGNSSSTASSVATSTSSSTQYIYVNISSTLAAEKTVFYWVSQTIVARTSNHTFFITAGGNGFAVYNGSQSPKPPSISALGYLTGVAFGNDQALLVGEKYQPGAGVLMYSYNPLTNKLVSHSKLFPASMQQSNATLAGAAWNGSVFYVLGLLNIHVNPTTLLLFSYNPVTNSLKNLSSLIPRDFARVNPCVSCAGSLGLTWTTFGLFIVKSGLLGSVGLGLLHLNHKFTNLTSYVPPTFVRPNAAGGMIATLGTDVGWNGSSVFLAGDIDNSPALLAFNPSTNVLTNYTGLVSPFSGTLLTIDLVDSQVYAGGLTPGGEPLLLDINPQNATVTNLSTLIPPHFGDVWTVAVSGQTIFLSGGVFGNLRWGLLVPV